MRHRQAGLVDLVAPIQEQVKVDRARAPAPSVARAAKVALHREQGIQELARAQCRVQRGRRIEEERLLHRPPRVGLAHPGDGDDLDAGSGAERRERRVERRPAVPEVGAEPDVRAFRRYIAKRMRCALLLAAGTAILTVAAATASARPAAYLSGAQVVGISPGARAEAIVRSAGASPVSRRLGIWALSSAGADRAVPALRRAGALRYVEPNRVIPTAHQPGDPLATPDLGWQIYRVGADQVEPPGPGVSISIVDSGLDMSNTEFATRPDVTLLNTQPAISWDVAELYHGTEVASVAAAPENGYGTVGIYPTAALRMYALAGVADGPTTADIVRGLTTASSIGRTVINLSLAGPGFSESEYEAVMSAVKRGALVVAAAGNDLARGNPRDYPGAYPHVLTAAATGKTDQPSSFSTGNAAVDLAAPGESIAVPHPTDQTIWKAVAGTSFSSPIVAAAAAWLWTVHPELDAGQVAEMLRESARDINSPGFDDRTGYGLVNLPAALTAPVPPKDLLEPNDDIDQVAAGRLFATGSTPLTTQAKRTVRISASLDQNEDPEDVYRVVVPAGRTFVATVTPTTNLGVILWSPAAKTVFAPSATVRKTTLAGSDRTGKRAERVVWKNTGKRAVTAYLDVWFSKGSTRRATYTASIAT